MGKIKNKLSLKGKKVCIMSSAHNALDHRVFYKEARSLAKAGLDVALIASHEKEEVKDGVRIIPLKTQGGKFARFSSGMWEIFLLALKENADVYHFHDPDLLIVGLLLKLKTKSKVIYDVHEFYSKSIKDKEWIPNILIREYLSFIYRILEYNISKLFDGIILVMHEQRGLFPENSFTEVIHNYPIIDFQNDVYKDIRKGNKLVYLGTLTEVRGLFFLIKSFKLVKEKKPYTILILGGKFHDNKFRKKVFDYIERNNLSDNIQYVGYIPFEEVNKYLQMSDIGVVTELTKKRNQGLPTKLFEFMQAKLPVVHKDLPQIRNYVIDSDCGLLVEGDDPKNFAEAIIELLENDEMRRKMGKNGHKAFIKYYNWSIEEKKLINFYKMILNNN